MSVSLAEYGCDHARAAAAVQHGKRTAVHLYGSLKGMADRLLESVRYSRWPPEVFDPEHARRIQIRLDSG